MQSNSKVIIGIDPDTDKNGVAVKINKNFLLYNFSFFKLYELLENLKNDKRPETEKTKEIKDKLTKFPFKEGDTFVYLPNNELKFKIFEAT